MLERPAALSTKWSTTGSSAPFPTAWAWAKTTSCTSRSSRRLSATTSSVRTRSSRRPSCSTAFTVSMSTRLPTATWLQTTRESSLFWSSEAPRVKLTLLPTSTPGRFQTSTLTVSKTPPTPTPKASARAAPSMLVSWVFSTTPSSLLIVA